MMKQPWEMNEQEFAEYSMNLDAEIAELKMQAAIAEKLRSAREWCDAIRAGKTVERLMKVQALRARLRAIGMEA